MNTHSKNRLDGMPVEHQLRVRAAPGLPDTSRMFFNMLKSVMTTTVGVAGLMPEKYLDTPQDTCFRREMQSLYESGHLHALYVWYDKGPKLLSKKETEAYLGIDCPLSPVKAAEQEANS